MTMVVNKEELLNAIAGMSVMDIVELTKMMEDKFGVSAAAPMAVAAASGAIAAPIEEKTEFAVLMTSFGANKVNVIKVVREITGLGLKEAKDLVESVPSARVKEGIAKADAEAIKLKLQEAGASVGIE